MDATQCLALCLAWTRSQETLSWLTMIFGVTASVGSLFIRFGRRILVRVLRSSSVSAVTMPSVADINRFKDAFRARHPLLRNAFCVADGLILRLEQSGDAMLQNAFYNGWTHDHYVSNIFLFAPNGRIIACALNAPGSFHNSTIADFGDIYAKLARAYEETGGRCVVDSAFCRARHPYLIKSGEVAENVDAGSAEHEAVRQATSARQAAEWGMHALQASFPRLKVRMLYEERGERRLILLTIVYLFNYRTAIVGLNQILGVFMPWLDCDSRVLF